MSATGYLANHRTREWRRRVSLRARVRSGSGWSDGHILNLSSRGLLVRIDRAVEPGSWIELREGAHSISGEVVWRSGRQAGIRADTPIPLDEWLEKSPAPQPRLPHNGRERRRSPRDHEWSRLLGRKLESIGIATLAAAIAISASLSAASILIAPIDRANAALTH